VAWKDTDGGEVGRIGWRIRRPWATNYLGLIASAFPAFVRLRSKLHQLLRTSLPNKTAIVLDVGVVFLSPFHTFKSGRRGTKK
jgi:hypothetical protein